MSEVESANEERLVPVVLVVDPAISVVEATRCLSAVIKRLSRATSTKEVSLKPIIKRVVASRETQSAAPYLSESEIVFALGSQTEGFYLGRALNGLVDDLEQEIERQKSIGHRVIKPQLVVLAIAESQDVWEEPLAKVFAETWRYRFGTLHLFCAKSIESRFVSVLDGVLRHEQYSVGSLGDGARELGPNVSADADASGDSYTPNPRWPKPSREPRSRLREFESPAPSLLSAPVKVFGMLWKFVEGSVHSVIGPFDESEQVEASAEPVEELAKPPTPETPEPPTVNSEVLAPRALSANGNPIIGEESSINKTPWWTSHWWQVGKDEICREVEIDIGTAADLAIIGLTSRGQSHRYGGLPNQDSFAILHDDVVPGFLFVAVSDGVSNASFSGYASRKLVRCVVRALHRRVLERVTSSDTPPSDIELRGLGSAAFREASDALLCWSEFEVLAPACEPGEIDPAELSATLTVAMIPVGLPPDGNRRALVGFVGDSPCYTLREKAWQLVTPATKAGETLNNATAALPFLGEGAAEVAWLDVRIPAGSAFFLMSDGFGTSLASGKSKVGEFLAAEWGHPRTVVDFLRAAEFDRAGEDDDRTVVAVWTPPFTSSPPRVDESAPSLGEGA
jgi:serine/threonine protein phosphatase PrpC